MLSSSSCSRNAALSSRFAKIFVRSDIGQNVEYFVAYVGSGHRRRFDFFSERTGPLKTNKICGHGAAVLIGMFMRRQTHCITIYVVRSRPN